MNECGSDLADRIRQNFQDSGRPDPPQTITQGEVRRYWSGVLKDADLSPFGSYYFNPLAGWADAGRALELMAEAVIGMGGRYEVGEVSRVVLGDRGVRGVETRSGELYTAKKVLLSTESRIESQPTATGVCVAHFQLLNTERKYQLPVYVYGGDGEVLHPTASGVLKFANSNSFKNTVETSSGRRISIQPPSSQLAAPSRLQAEFVDSIRGRLPRLFDSDLQIDYYRLCWDAITPNQHPLIASHPHPQLSNLYLAAGGLFHCWKFLQAIGRYVANVLDGISNGPELDEAWKWKQEQGKARGVHASYPKQRTVRLR